MTAKIQFMPSTRFFEAEGEETILDAALRAGVNVRYHCNTGSCGDCKARIISGLIGEKLPHDFVFSTKEKAEQFVLLCRCKARTAVDLVIETQEDHQASDIPMQSILTRVNGLQKLTNDVMVLNLRTPRSQTLRFLAGQHAKVTIGNLTPRHKSVASCPCNGMALHLHIRHVPGDEFSEYVFTKLKNQDRVEIEGPYGSFTLDEASSRPIIFLAYETGFSPIKSIIEHAIALDLTQAMSLYWIARSKEDLYLYNLCRTWVDALDAFEFHPVICDEEFVQQSLAKEVEQEELGGMDRQEKALLIAATKIVQDHPDLSAFDIYINGSQSLLAPTLALFQKHQCQSDRVFVDYLEKL